MTALKYRIIENNVESITTDWQASVAAAKRGAMVEKVLETISNHLPVDEERREKILKKFGYI